MLCKYHQSYNAIYEWKLKLDEFDNFYNVCLLYVVTRKEELKPISETIKMVDSPYYYGLGCGGYKIANGKWTSDPGSRFVTWGDGDLFTIELNCFTKSIMIKGINKQGQESKCVHKDIKTGHNVKYRLVVGIVKGTVSIQGFECRTAE